MTSSSIDGKTSRLKRIDKSISELEDRTMEITKSEEKRKNRLENHEQGLMGFMKYERKRMNIHVISVLEGKGKRGELEKCMKILSLNCSNEFII